MSPLCGGYYDVKALEYFIKEKIGSNTELLSMTEFIHFACTSEDINNLAYALMLKIARTQCLPPLMNELTAPLEIIMHILLKLSYMIISQNMHMLVFVLI